MSIQKKVVILGDSGVGKTSILFRYITGGYDDSSLPTLGASYKPKKVSLPTEKDEI